MPKQASKMRPLDAAMLVVAAEVIPSPVVEAPKPKVVPWGEPLNLRVTPEFKAEFQLWAARKNVRFTDVLHQAFEALLGSSSSEPEKVELPPRVEAEPKDSMNFRVTTDFRIAYRTYAVQRRLRLNDVIVLAFQALKDSTA